METGIRQCGFEEKEEAQVNRRLTKKRLESKRQALKESMDRLSNYKDDNTIEFRLSEIAHAVSFLLEGK